jgi:hypothetical protein
MLREGADSYITEIVGNKETIFWFWSIALLYPQEITLGNETAEPIPAFWQAFLISILQKLAALNSIQIAT